MPEAGKYDRVKRIVVLFVLGTFTLGQLLFMPEEYTTALSACWSVLLNTIR
jgi:hypothetical protein